MKSLWLQMFLLYSSLAPYTEYGFQPLPFLTPLSLTPPAPLVFRTQSLNFLAVFLTFLSPKRPRPSRCLSSSLRFSAVRRLCPRSCYAATAPSKTKPYCAR